MAAQQTLGRQTSERKKRARYGNCTHMNILTFKNTLKANCTFESERKKCTDRGKKMHLTKICDIFFFQCP